MRRSFFTFLAVLTLATTAALSSADTISYTSAAFNGSTSFTASFQQFNPALGTLLSASVNLDAQVTPDAAVYNEYLTSEPFIYAFNTTYADNPVTGQPVFSHNPLVWMDAYGNSASTDYTVLIQPGTANPGFNVYDGAPIAANLVSNIPPADLAAFEGAGSQNFTYTASGDGNDGGSDSVSPTSLYYGGGYTFNGMATVTYTYTAVPEPSALVLFGVGAIGLFAYAWRRRQAT